MLRRNNSFIMLGFRVETFNLINFLIAFAVLNIKTLALGSTAIPHNQKHEEVDLRTLMINSYIATTDYIAPSLTNLDLAEQLFVKLLTTRNFSLDDVASWSTIDMKLQNATDINGTNYAVVSEFDPVSGNGHGFYAIKLGRKISDSEKTKFLQAPHRPSDLHTHEITFDLLTMAKVFGAAAWSTTHRNIVDLCKEPNSYFNSFTKAVAKSVIDDSPTILQVHGFNKGSQEVDVDIVFSSTKRILPPEFNPIANCIKEELEHWILLKYPEEVNFLGGTLNINAEKFYQESLNGKFIHFETSRELREELRVNPALKLKIVKCV